MRTTFAIPGDLATPTGGYGYARRVLRGASEAGIDLQHLALGGGFPHPEASDLSRAQDQFATVRAGQPLLIDGLAYGALPGDVISTIKGPIVALCHHPLAFETGLAPARAEALKTSERTALSLANAVIAASAATAGILEDQYNVPTHRITVAPPGTDPAPRAPASGEPRCTIVSIGSITPRKGQLRLVRTLGRLRDVDWKLRLIGPMPDPAYLDRLRDEIGELGLAERIELTGPLSMTAVTAAYQSADLFVLASEYEGFGMAFAEAMSHGLPVLGLECPAVAEATLGAARLARAADFEAELSELVNRPAARAELAERCWRAAGRLPRWPDTITRIADVLRAVA